jgi:glutamate dehydrogenase (NAD(P)+)
VAVSCWDPQDRKAYTYCSEAGIDAELLQSMTNTYGTIDKAKAAAAGITVEDGDAWLSKEVEVLIPAAMEGMLTAETAPRVRSSVRIIAEGANGPTTREADRIFADRRLHVIPDILCNAGGVVCSYFEGVQNDMNYYWDKDEVMSKLDRAMTNAFAGVAAMRQARNVYARHAAYMVAIDRVVRAMHIRGWI